MPLKAILFDLGHTILDENVGRDQPVAARPAVLMPGAREALHAITLPKAICANSRSSGDELRQWLARAEVAQCFTWVITSAEIGFRKPDARFFAHALHTCGLAPEDVLFVGNQLNTDIAGAEHAGIASVYLAGGAYRSADEHFVPDEVAPSFVIESLAELPALVRRLQAGNTHALAPR